MFSVLKIEKKEKRKKRRGLFLLIVRKNKLQSRLGVAKGQV